MSRYRAGATGPCLANGNLQRFLLTSSETSDRGYSCHPIILTPVAVRRGVTSSSSIYRYTSFSRDFLAFCREGGYLRKHSVKAAARPTSTLALVSTASLFLSLYLGVALRPLPPTSTLNDTPFAPSVSTTLPWPARAVSRVQRTPRFALRPWRVFLVEPFERSRSFVYYRTFISTTIRDQNRSSRIIPLEELPRVSNDKLCYRCMRHSFIKVHSHLQKFEKSKKINFTEEQVILSTCIRLIRKV